MNLSNIETIAIIVQIDGNAHQVLATAENKRLMLHMLAQMEGTLKVSNVIEPVEFKEAK